MNQEPIESQWRAFWNDVLQRQHWIEQDLVRRIGCDKTSVSNWVNGKYAPGAANIVNLIELGFLNEAEERRLIELRLLDYGFSRASLARVARACAGSPQALTLLRQAMGQDGIPPAPTRILALSPFPGKSLIFFNMILTGITERAGNLGYEVLVKPIWDLKAKRPLHEYYHDLRDLRGVIAITCHVADSSWVDDCRGAEIPLVLVHDNVDPQHLVGQGKIAVLAEKLDGLNNLVRHLVLIHECRHLRVVITDYRTPHHANRRKKIEEIKQAVAECAQDAQCPDGVTFDEGCDVKIAREYTYAEGRRLAEEEHLLDGDVDAVICMQDVVAQAVADIAAARGTRTGRRVLVTGYDNSDVAQDHELTTVDQHLRPTGREAVNQLHYLARRRLATIPKPVEWPISTSLVTGSCCAET
jgi:DNA-binding LacI/PurR family transcriptional regulator